MGNKTNRGFSNLEAIPKEKSLHSYNVRLVEINYENDYKNFTKIKKNIEYKLKLYPSTLTLKNDTHRRDFSYYDILCWSTVKKFLTFKTVRNETYSIITDELAVNIASSIKEICSEILKNERRNILE